MPFGELLGGSVARAATALEFQRVGARLADPNAARRQDFIDAGTTSPTADPWSDQAEGELIMARRRQKQAADIAAVNAEGEDLAALNSRERERGGLPGWTRVTGTPDQPDAPPPAPAEAPNPLPGDKPGDAQSASLDAEGTGGPLKSLGEPLGLSAGKVVRKGGDNLLSERFDDPRLNDTHNKAVEMAHNGASNGDIADELGLTEGNVWSILSRARNDLGIDVPKGLIHPETVKNTVRKLVLEGRTTGEIIGRIANSPPSSIKVLVSRVKKELGDAGLLTDEVARKWSRAGGYMIGGLTGAAAAGLLMPDDAEAGITGRLGNNLFDLIDKMKVNPSRADLDGMRRDFMRDGGTGSVSLLQLPDGRTYAFDGDKFTHGDAIDALGLNPKTASRAWLQKPTDTLDNAQWHDANGVMLPDASKSALGITLDPRRREILDGFQEDATQESLDAAHRNAIANDQIPTVYKLFKDAAGKIMAWDGLKFDHSEARDLLGLGDSQLKHGQFRWGSNLKFTDWYETTGKSGGKPLAGVAVGSGLAAGAWLADPNNEADAGTLSNMLRGIKEPLAGQVKRTRVVSPFAMGPTDDASYHLIYTDPKGDYGIQGTMQNTPARAGFPASSSFSFSLPLRPEPGSTQRVFADAYKMFIGEVNRTGRPVYQFYGASAGHDALYDHMFRRLDPPPGYRGLIFSEDIPGGTDQGARFMLVRNDVADAVLNDYVSMGAHPIFDSAKSKLSPQSAGGAAGVLAAAGAGSAAVLDPDDADAGTLSSLIKAGKVPKLTGPVAVTRTDWGRALHYEDPGGGFSIHLDVSQAGDRKPAWDRSARLRDNVSDLKGYHENQRWARDNQPNDFNAADITFTLGDTPKSGNNQKIFSAVLGLVRKEIQQRGEPIYQFTGDSPAHERLYSTLMASGATFPGYRNIIASYGGPRRNFYLVRDDVADSTLAKLKNSGDDIIYNSAKGEAPAGWRTAGAVAALSAGAALNPDDADASPQGAVLRGAADGVRAIAGQPPEADAPDDGAHAPQPYVPPSVQRGQWVDNGPTLVRHEGGAIGLGGAEAGEKPKAPDFWSETVPAAFRRENVIGSALNDWRVTDTAARRAVAMGGKPAFNPFEGDYLKGFEQDSNAFSDIVTKAEADSMKLQITRERQDNQTLQLAGLPGLAAQLVAGTLDPTVFIPVGGEAKVGDSLLRLTMKGVYGASAGAALSEGMLHSTQQTRTPEESAMAVTGAAFLGGLGGRFLRPREIKAAAGKVAEDLVLKGAADPQFKAELDDQATMRAVFAGGELKEPASVGAAATPATTSVDNEALADAFGIDKVSGAVHINPILTLAASPSAKAREISNQLAENGMFLARNSKGEASPLAVETAMHEYRGWEAQALDAHRSAFKAMRKDGIAMTQTDFAEAVGQAMRRGDQDQNPFVAQSAAAWRVAVEKTKDRAIEQGLLPPDVAVETASSYFHRLWNRKVLISRPEEFKAMTSNWLQETFEHIKQRAFNIESEAASRKGAIDTSRDAMRAAGSDATKASGKHKAMMGQLMAAYTRRDESSEAAIEHAANWRDAKAKGEPADVLEGHARGQEIAQNAVTRHDDRIAELEAKIKDHESVAAKAAKDAEDAKAAHAGVRNENELSTEDKAAVAQGKHLAEMERIEGSLSDYANQIADEIHKTLIGYDSRTMPAKITITERGPLAERTFSIPDLYKHGDTSVEHFLVDDVEHVMSRYMRVMSADIELARAFGDPDMKVATDKVNADYEKLTAKAEKTVTEAATKKAAKGKAGEAPDPVKLQAAVEKAKRNLNQRREDDIRNIEGMRDIIRGTYGRGTNPSSTWKRGAALVRAWNYATLLGGMTASSFTDVAGKVLSNGYLGVTRDLLIPLMADMKGVKIAATEARHGGVAIERSLNARATSIADIGDPYGHGSSFERMIAGATNRFTAITGMRLWNDVMKTADYVLAENRMIRTLNSEKPSSRDVRWLAWAGVGHGEDMGNRIRAQLEKYGDTDRAMRLGNVEKWDDEEAARAFKAVMAKEAATVTISPGAGDKLLAMHTDLGKTIGQFKTFTMAAHNRLTIRGAQMARAGDGAVVSYMTSAISMGILVYYLKMWDSLREPSTDPAVIVREGLDRSGMLPILFEVLNSGEKITGHSLTGNAMSSRFASRNALATVLGPAAGRMQDTFSLISNLTDGNLKDTDVHAIRKLIPYNNLSIVRQMFDRLEIGVDNAVGAQHTAFSSTREKAMAR